MASFGMNRGASGAFWVGIFIAVAVNVVGMYVYDRFIKRTTR